jgi:hypothetical protein
MINPAVVIEQVDEDTIILTETEIKPGPGLIAEEINITTKEPWVPKPITPKVSTPAENVIAPNVISINSSVPNDGRAYYAMIIFNGHTEETMVYKLRNRQVVEVTIKDYNITSIPISPESFTFVRCCEARDFK